MKLIEVTQAFATEEQCLAYLEARRWPNGVRCLTCGSKEISRITRKVTKDTDNKRAQLYQCLEPGCKQQFSATTGTIFNGSHLPLDKWFRAIGLLVDAKKDMSALQLQRHLKINYRTAWYLAHRVREAMDDPEGLKLTAPSKSTKRTSGESSAETRTSSRAMPYNKLIEENAFTPFVKYEPKTSEPF